MKTLLCYGVRFLIVIDDIDRLSPDEALLVKAAKQRDRLAPEAPLHQQGRRLPPLEAAPRDEQEPDRTRRLDEVSHQPEQPFRLVRPLLRVIQDEQPPLVA